ncbi:NADP-specific glutamate dehydrogenase-like isoform X1 [Zingiber officinale]|uniref:NADP-specific glutamate dehydrogenase-like isoform X1 n=1 Tax=Zingiber officinale TaxID=94328 RepID=UPI001C4C20EE|nr:NADP-specific glutamate dehydrogenase-like isoform X1 [Zingiber officinale]
MNSSIDEITLLHQAQARVTSHHHMVVRGIGEEIDLEIGPGDDDPTFSSTTLVGVPTHESVAPEDQDDHKQILLASQVPTDDQSQLVKAPQGKRKKKVVKKWREEWADTYKWACVDMHEGTARIFCSVCREYGRKHRRNPYGNEGSRNMQMSALEEHNNSLLHKEALRLQMASKDKVLHVDKPVYVKALMSKSASSILESVLRRDPHEVEFIQSVQEVVHSLEPVLLKNSQYVHILERLLEPDRVLIFRVPWVDDRGEVHVNRGFRVQFSQVLGPCRGGLRFHPSMNLSITKFLGFDQTLKNALSPYKLGGAGGGSDFDPKGKSESEQIMRFCQSFMDELYKYLGPDQDLPAEDMGVGPREMGYLFGQYRRLSGHFQVCVLLPIFLTGICRDKLFISIMEFQNA